VVVSENIDNDELAAFVTSSLNAIARGVERATSDTRAFVVPSKVQFEVAVKATKGREAGGGLRIQVFSAEGKASSNDENVSRITFEVQSAQKNTGGSIDYGDWKTA
jgi:hypothetical protein